jgi:transcription initiation factor TFIID TATA-box-binding protein
MKYDISQLTKTTKESPQIHIQNCVATFSLGLKDLNLRDISQKLQYCDFNPPKFAAMTIRIKNPKTTALTFSSGNMVCTGSKNIDESLLACRKYTRLLQNAGIKVCFQNFHIQNIVASAGVSFPLKLHQLASDHGPYVSYEPSLFPGAVLRVENPKVVFLLFRSGKIVITGAKDIKQIRNAFLCIYEPFILKYQDKENLNTSSSAYRVNSKKRRLSVS